MKPDARPLPQVIVHPDGNVLAAAVAARLITRLIDLQSFQAPIHLVLTGGTVGIKTLREIAASPAAAAVDWSQVHFWWGDERFLPQGDPDRNETQARRAFLDSFADRIPESNIHYVPRLDSEAGFTSPDDAAEAYAEELKQYAVEGRLAPEFDVLLLGVGPDGHVASLFPGHPSLHDLGITVGVRNSPKPPPERVSLTFEAIGYAKAVWLVVAGEDKAQAVATAWSEVPKEESPSGAVSGSDETLWLVDVAATKLAQV